MLSLKGFILETALSSSLAADDKGKLHELLLAKHLHSDGKLPLHHRSESENPDHAGTPEQVHDKLKTKIGSAAYKEISGHAKSTADALKKHMETRGHIPKGGSISDVHWTSNRDTPNKAGDHEKTTGKKDVNSNADLILSVNTKNGKHHSFHGVSAKYGTNSKPNFKNSGLDSLEKQSGVKSGSFTNQLVGHTTRMDKLGYTGTRGVRHLQHKADLTASGKGDKIAGARVHAAEQSSLHTRNNIAKDFAKGLSKKSDLELRDHIRSQVAPETTHNHMVAHSHVHNDGTAKPVIHDAHHIADEHLNKFKNLHVKHSGISATIRGTNKETGKIGPVAKHTIKATSGPHKGVAGMFTL